MTLATIQTQGAGVTVYDGFISYSHAADGMLAPRLQSALQRFAKPWWKRRAVRIFRDESSLAANPQLWSSITRALDASSWFILLLSPDAAQSEWVNKEIAYWRTARDPAHILPVVTDGGFSWAGSDIAGDAVPHALLGAFEEEPRWVDARWAKGEKQLDLKDPRFADAVADIASTIRHIPKEDLASEEVTQYRRTVRTAWSAGALVGVLALAATGFAIQSARNAAEADRQALIAADQAYVADATASAEARARALAELNAAFAHSEALAGASLIMADVDPELASLLVVQAMATSDKPAALEEALRRAWTADRLLQKIDSGNRGLTFVDVASDGSRLAVSTPYGGLTMLDSSGDTDWTYDGGTVDSFLEVRFSPDDDLVAVAIADSSSRVEVFPTRSEADDMPSRVLILDSSDGAVQRVLDYPGCEGAGRIAWRPGGDVLAVASGFTPCTRGGYDVWVELVDTATWERVRLVETPEFESQGLWSGPWPAFDAQGRLYVFSPTKPTEVYGEESYELLHRSTGVGMGDVAPDGSIIVTASSFHASVRRTDGSLLDRLPLLPEAAREPVGVVVSDSSALVAIGTEGRWTFVFDLSTGEQTHALPTGPAVNVAFDEDGDRLVTSHMDGTVAIWDIGERETLGLAVDELVEGLRSRLRRSFTPTECDTYRIDPCPSLEDLRGSLG